LAQQAQELLAKKLVAPSMPFEWHDRPRGYSLKSCPICGIARRHSGIHRAVRHDESIAARFIVRGKNGAPDVAIKRPGKRSPPTLTRRVRDLLVRAAALTASGKSRQECAQLLGVKVEAMQDWHTRYPVLWQAAYDKTIQNTLAIVRAEAGTDAVLVDVDGYMNRATVAERWCRSRNEPLFQPSAALTLCGFYRDWYVPNRLADAVPQTVEAYEVIMRRWLLITGDPPLKEIKQALLTRFFEVLRKSRGLTRTRRMSLNTVRRFHRHLMAVLGKTGQPGYRNRDAAGALDGQAPWVKPPKEIKREPKIVPDEDLEAVFTAAACMDVPRFPGIKPAAWWRALLIVSASTGLRSNTLLALKLSDLDWSLRRLRVRSVITKTQIEQWLRLDELTMRYLLAIRTDRDLMFPWERSRENFYRQVRKLMQIAGLPPDRRFGLHALRKTLATKLAETDPAAAMLALGHTTFKTTKAHYIQSEGIISRALERIHLPDAFKDFVPETPGLATA